MRIKSETHLITGLQRYFTPNQLAKLESVQVGIAGAGGIGSNTAMILARSGIGRMRVIDYDTVEPSNLNRQHFWPGHLGLPKVEALATLLLDLNPNMELDIRPDRIDTANLPDTLEDCPIWVEALDDAAAKAMLVERALLAGAFVVSASGICGIGGEPLGKRRIGNLVVVGDFRTGLESAPPVAPRVIQAAALMADCVLEHILIE